jgi:hypothetical protein
MSDIREYTDLELIDHLDFAEKEADPCFWKYPIPCDKESDWEVLWSCGHTRGYCDEHLIVAQQMGNAVCSGHGDKPTLISIVAILPR